MTIDQTFACSLLVAHRADTDADGLNDSEELNLGSDGFVRWSLPKDLEAVGFGDSAGLILTILGLLFALEPPVPGLSGELAVWLSLLFEVAGLRIVLKKDALDLIPINPLRNIEEILAVAGLAHSALTAKNFYGV